MSRDIRGGQPADVTAGLDWYLFPNLRLMLNYIHFVVTDRLVVAGDPQVNSSGDVFQSRMQVDFRGEVP